MSDIHDARTAAADAEWQAFDFQGTEPEDSSGWQSDGSDQVVRAVFFPAPEGGEGGTVKGHFAVVFDGPDSTVVKEAYAALGGNIFGERGPAAAALGM